MKKTILFFFVVAALSTSSCKKWTCYCSDGSQSTVSGTSATQAESHCVAKGNNNVVCAI